MNLISLIKKQTKKKINIYNTLYRSDNIRIVIVLIHLYFFFFFFNDTATTEIYTLSLHDALPNSPPPDRGVQGGEDLLVRRQGAHPDRQAQDGGEVDPVGDGKDLPSDHPRGRGRAPERAGSAPEELRWPPQSLRAHLLRRHA